MADTKKDGAPKAPLPEDDDAALSQEFLDLSQLPGDLS